MIRLAPLVCAAALLAAACSATSPERPRGGVRVVSGDGLADTVTAVVSPGLLVEVRDSLGQPAKDLVVRFEAVMPESNADAWLGVAPEGSGSFAFTSLDSTDALGQAGATVVLGPRAGTALLRVVVPLPGYVTTASFTVLPGAPVQVVVEPADTALYAGSRFTLRVSELDRFGNRRASRPASFGESGDAISVDAAGSVGGVAIGRGSVVTSVQGTSDTTFVSVVPAGVLAAYKANDNGLKAIVTFNLDGSGYRELVQYDYYGDASPSWTRDGSAIVYHRGQGAPRLHVVGLDGVDRPLIGSASELQEEMWAQASRADDWVYFAGGRSGFGLELWRVRLTGSGLELISPTLPYASTYTTHPAPSPDGTRLAFAAQQPDSGLTIMIVDLPTGQLTPLRAAGVVPRWAPSGESIAFLAPLPDRIDVVNADGSNRRTVTPPGVSYAYGVAWSPDERWMLARNSSRLELIDLTSGMILPLPYSSLLVQPSWRP